MLTIFLALAVYEFVVAFGQEVKTGWERKLSAANILLISTRWIMVLMQIFGWATFIPGVGSSDKITFFALI